MDGASDTVPATGFDFAFAVAAYTLGLEMGVTGTEVVMGLTTVNAVIPIDSSGGGKPIGTDSSGSSSTGLKFMDGVAKGLQRIMCSSTGTRSLL